MSPDDKKHETKFKCPNCQQPIVSRFTYCKQCKTKFSRDTLFSCPRCGALVRQLERVCPGCKARLTDWGVGAEWLTRPVVSPSQKRELPKETEPAPVELRPIEELKMPEQTERRRKLVHVPTRKPAPSKITRSEVLGRTNGLTHGRVNGTKQGLVNGTNRGRVNGTKKGLVNGTKQGRVNGFKAPVASERKEESLLLRRMIGGRVPVWQLVAVYFAVILLLSSAMILSLAPATPDQSGIVIDGQFSDWASISSYRFSELLPGNIPQAIEAKMNASDDRLNLYLRVQDNAFAGSDPSTFYFLIDADSNVDTGYLVPEHRLGADRLITLSGWDGHLKETLDSNFSGTDQENWTAWQSGTFVSVIQSQSEIEMSIPYLSGNSLVQLETTVTGREYSSPIMSTHGTVVAKQESLLTGQLATTATQPIIRLTAIAMGVPGGNITVMATVSNDTDANLASQNLQISSTSWTTNDITINLSSLSDGDSFSFKMTLSSSQFTGSVDVDGLPIGGYYLSIPSNIVVDGLFGDWIGKKVSDSDPLQVENPNIDISEYGACTQNNSHLFYVVVVGDVLGGADVPEKRSRPSSGGGDPSLVVRLRKTGEDLLQVFIDKDPGNGTGQVIIGGNKTIGADYLVEMFGRKGHVMTRWVMQWSSPTQEWTHIVGFGNVAVGGQGIEFSVNKTALGNLTTAEVIILTTDWKAESDNCWLKNALSDPWASTSNGNVYQSGTGVTWSMVDGTIPLVGSEYVVDMCTSPNHDFVFVVTNEGRLYEWVIGSNTTWHLSIMTTRDNRSVTLPTNITSVTIAPGGPQNWLYIMNKAGYMWWVNPTQWNPAQDWTIDTRRIGSYGDFKDFYWDYTAAKEFVVIRSAQNTKVFFGGTSGLFTQSPTATGSSSPQVSVYNIYLGGTTKEYRIWVLCQNGAIRYSYDDKGATRGTTWVARGNLPTPGSGTPTLPPDSTYVGIAADLAGSTLWVITNTSYCYKSIDGGATWTYTGNFSVINVAAFTAPIPEFDSLLIPIMAIVLPIIAFSRKRRRQS